MKNNFMPNPNNLNKPSQPFQKASQVITAIVIIFFVILIGGCVYYYCLVAESAISEVLGIDKAPTDKELLEQLKKDIKWVEEMERLPDLQEQLEKDAKELERLFEEWE